jgi:hypothetical protein
MAPSVIYLSIWTFDGGQGISHPDERGGLPIVDEGPDWIRREADPPMELPKQEQREAAESPAFSRGEVHSLLVWQCPLCGRLEPYVRRDYIQQWFHCDRMRLRLRSDI